MNRRAWPISIAASARSNARSCTAAALASADIGSLASRLSQSCRRTQVDWQSTQTPRKRRVLGPPETLLCEWPEQNGPAYINAKEALTKALQDPSSDSARAAARMAFAAAADEAGILRE
ncbi:MAG: DUF982 domain-containing protein [Neoaquamicrobium sediminum]|uniref:DUF982 domain-containing protein n=1 Tax=Neoaquamicrobium sediminum TaxID=1849104 RepID=UPI0040352E98